MKQADLDDLCDGLVVKYDVLDNLSGGRAYFSAQVTFTNNSRTTLTFDQGWGLYFSHLHTLEPDYLLEDEEYIYVKQGLKIRQLDGDLHCITPTLNFNDLQPGMTLTLPITSEACSVSRYDHFPNWYISIDENTHNHEQSTKTKLKSRVIKSTVGEGLKFIGAFDSPKKWKRYDYKKHNGDRIVDCYDPPTAKTMFEENQTRLVSDVCQNTKLFVIPSPKHMEIDETDVMEMVAADWSIVCLSDGLGTEARFLSDALNIKSTTCASDECAQPTTNSIYLQVQTNEEFMSNSVHDKSSSMNAVNNASSNAATNKATNASTNTSMHAETNAATNEVTKTVDSYEHTNGQPMSSPINLTVSTQSSREHYHLTTNPSTCTIHITAPSNCGVFYGIQTLLSLLHNETSLPRVTITDEPCYAYRGMHIDVARNFHSKTEILRLIDAMAMYKLNYLHLHLCDDEGWRLEIPGLAELTSVCGKRGHDPSEKTCLMPYLGSGPSITNISGTAYYSPAEYREIPRYVCSKRGHDPSEKTCLMPYLGSGPSITNSSGTGYYSTADYREILRYATQRHVHVIPEIDLPGHAHAAINAMQVRYERLVREEKRQEAEEYLLLDRSTISDDINVASVRYERLVREGKRQEAEEYLLLDRSTISDDINVASVQNFHCNAVDPTLDSTYNFIDKVVSTLVSYHADICPLKVFHIGGDEVPYSVWGTYGSCRKLYEDDQITSFMDLMETFITRASQIVDKHHLTLGVWQDGLLVSTKRGIIPRDKIVPQDCWSYAWRNNYDMAHGDCAVSLANAGYKVIQCEGSHLYFDHPQSPHPEDSGLYWAARYIDTHKTFSLTPDDLIGCHDVTQCGAEVTDEDRQDTREMWSTLDNPHHVIGIQGHLWSELVRTPARLHTMVFPRLLALAERAWHTASWEDMEKIERENVKQADWSRFSACVGMKELQRLDELGIHYHLPIPGAIKKDGHLHMNGTFINQPLEYSMDGGESWVTYTEPVATETTGIIVRSSSADHKRHSIQSTITPTQEETTSSSYLCCLKAMNVNT